MTARLPASSRALVRLALVAIATLPSMLAAQRTGATVAATTRDSQAVADVASRYVAATMLHDYDRAATLADPAQALPLRAAIVRLVELDAANERRFRAMRDSMERRLREARTRADTNRIVNEHAHASSVSHLVSADTQDVPRARVDTALARVHAARVLTALRGRPTLGALLAMPDTAFLAVVLAGTEDAAWEQLARHDPSMARIEPSPSSPEELPPIRVVDVVIEQDSVAHVLVRPSLAVGDERFDWGGDDEVGIMTTMLLQLRRRPGGWRVRLGEDERHDLETAVRLSRDMRPRRP